jgi:hypothetical protein
LRSPTTRGVLEDGGDLVQPFVAVDDHRRGIVVVEARERGVRAVGVEADEGAALVDEVLRQHTRDDRLADAAFFATDEVE